MIAAALPCCAGVGRLWTRGMGVYVLDGFGAFPQPKLECVFFCKIHVVGVYVARHNVYIFSVYRNPDTDDKIFLC